MQRIDKLLLEKGFFESRSSAQAAIMAGLVSVSGRIVEKSSVMVKDEAKVEVKETPRYVSRGGYKLEKALDEFKVDVRGKVALDAGASTGGFTQVLLERGIKKVIAVDVGYGQFHYKLRKDKRVQLFEKTNIRYFNPEIIEAVDLAVIDLSFISVEKVIENVLAMMKKEAEAIVLIKPQFEAVRKSVVKGVVKSLAIHEKVINEILDSLEARGLHLKGLTFSPIKGPKGNIEFLAYLKRKGKRIIIATRKGKVNEVVGKAHSTLLP